MSIELTEPQLRALDAGGEAIRLVDPRTNSEYRLVPVPPTPDPADDRDQTAARRIARRNAAGRAAGEP